MANKRQQFAQEAARRNRERANDSLEKVEDNEMLLNAEVEDDTVDMDDVKDTVAPQLETDETIHVQEKVDNSVSTNTVDIAALRGKLTTAGQLVLEAFMRYIDAMDPGKIMSVKEGIRHQASLWSAISTMFNRLDDPDFNILYREILNLFEEHKHGALGDDYVYRFAEEWEFSATDRAAFKRLVTLMLATRKASERAYALTQIKNWGYILEYGLNDRARNRIRNFYDI